MASLKEVKGRISSINGTLKIKMVASAKLHKAQGDIENMLPYERRLHHMLTNFLSSGQSVESPFIVKRDVRKIAIVVFASNSSLCGGFNSNVIRHLQETVEEYTKTVGKENILIYPVGRKVADATKKMGFTPMGDYQHMSGKPNYQEASDLAVELINRYMADEIQEVILLYNHFKSTSSQVLTREAYLPLDLEAEQKANAVQEGDKKGTMEADYIIEPSAERVMQELLPKVLRLKIYTVLLDSAAAEHACERLAARTHVALQQESSAGHHQ